MEDFAKHSRNMSAEQSNIISKKAGGLFVFNFIQWHTSPSDHVCFLDEELEAELLESAQLSEARLTSILKYFRRNNIIKAVRFVDGDIGYAINPELTGEDSLQKLYDSWIDGDYRHNKKATQEFKENKGSNGENKEEEESNKSINKEEEPKDDPKDDTIDDIFFGKYNPDPVEQFEEPASQPEPEPEEQPVEEITPKGKEREMTPLEIFQSMGKEKPLISQKVPELDATVTGSQKPQRMCLGGTMTVEEMRAFWDSI